MFVDVNEQWVKTFGYTKQEALGKTSAELRINRDLKGRARVLAELLQQGFVRDLELSLFTKSGEERIVSNNLDVVALGEEQYLLSTIYDITERKRAEEALQESEKRFRLVLDSMIETFVIVEPVYENGDTPVDFRYIEINPAAAGLANMRRDDIVGKRLLELFPACSRGITGPECRDRDREARPH